jgi:threonine dehydratase
VSITLSDIKSAAQRLNGVAIRTPLLTSAVLDERLAARVYIKPECLQHIGAFKFRGAYNRMSQLSDQQKTLGVVAFSSGNHAQGVAYAAQIIGTAATIVMPSDAPKIKLENTKRLGATVRLYDRGTESREEIAAEIATTTGATLVPAFDDLDIIAGQGTCALELIEQLHEKESSPDILLCPCGGGGLLAGVSTAVKSLQGDCKIYGVEPENYDDHLQSKLAGERVTISPPCGTSCDALMATSPGEITWSINSNTVDDYLVVTEEEVKHAISFAFRYLKVVVEPGGVVPLAALLSNKIDVKGQTVAIILSGGNIDSQSYSLCLEQYPSP